MAMIVRQFMSVATVIGAIALLPVKPLASGAIEPPSAPVTKAQAVEYGHAVNLRATDVHGMTAKEPEEELVQKHETTDFARCYRIVDPRAAIADLISPQLESHRQLLALRSRVQVMPSEALAARDHAGVKTRRSRRCVERAFHELDRSARVEVSALADPLPGTPGAFGMQITGELPIDAATKTTFHFHEHFFGFTVGAAEVELITVGVDGPTPSAIERRLLLLLLTRAKAARL